MMKVILGLCLLCLASRTAHAAPLPKTEKVDGTAAPQGEVEVLMFGVIQFGESLQYVYETTEAKIEKIGQKMKSHKRTLKKLGRQTEQAAEVDKQMKEVIQLLQAQMAKQQAEAKKTNDWLADMEQEEAELRTKVEKLEGHMVNSALTNVKELQGRAQELSDVLRGLQHFTEFQKEIIETQDEKLSKLLQVRDVQV